WGESSAMAGSFYSAETPDSCERELVASVLPALAGREFGSMAELERWLLGAAATPFVRGAVGTAAWGMGARARGVSLRRLFGIAERPVVSGLAVGLYDTLEELRAAFERYGAKHYARVKIKIEPGRDVALVRAAREWLGDFPLFVDANAAYTRADLGVFEALDE